MKSLPPEEIALAHRYRRWLLYTLFAHGNPIRLPDIAHQLTVWEQRGDRDSGDDPLRKRLNIYNALYHDHLPVLSDAHLVKYYQQADEVELGSAARQIEAVVERRLKSEIDALLAAERESMDPV